jgi:hypothetical protein
MTETLCKNLQKGGRLVLEIFIKAFDQKKLEDVDVNGIDVEFITYKNTRLDLFKKLINQG